MNIQIENTRIFEEMKKDPVRFADFFFKNAFHRTASNLEIGVAWVKVVVDGEEKWAEMFYDTAIERSKYNA